MTTLSGHLGMLVLGGATPSHVQSLMHFESDFSDVKGNTWTASGVTIDTTSPIQGIGSGLWSSGRLYTTDKSAFNFGSSDFTIEISCNFSSLPSSGAYCFVSRYADTGSGFSLQYRNDAGSVLRFNTAGDGGSYDFAWTPSTNTRYDIAIVRQGTTLYAFVNGVMIGSPQTNSTVMTSLGPYLVLGALYYTVGGAFIQQFNGLLDEFRLTPGIARYTNNYTPVFPLTDSDT